MMEQSHAEEAESGEITGQLNLSQFPPIYVSDTHFRTEDLHELEEQLTQSSATLTYDLTEARILLSKSERKGRIQFDLRAKGVWTEDASCSAGATGPVSGALESPRAVKRAKLGNDQGNAIDVDDLSTASEGEDDDASKDTTKEGDKQIPVGSARTPSPTLEDAEDLITVVRIDWFQESKKTGRPAPLADFTSFRGRRIPRPATTHRHHSDAPEGRLISPTKISPSKSVWERAREDAPASAHNSSRTTDRLNKRKFGQSPSKPSGLGGSWEAGHSHQPRLLHATTSEAEGSSSANDLPEPPAVSKAVDETPMKGRC
jgi:DNA polymerase IV